MTNSRGREASFSDEAFRERILANLIQTPDVFASWMNEVGLGTFVAIQGAIQLAVSDHQQVQIVNPRNMWTLVIQATVQPSSPIIEFKIIKDQVPTIDVSAFNLFDKIIPNTYTPIRNTGWLDFTNLSALSTPSVSYYVETLQVRTEVWSKLRDLMLRAMSASIGIRLQ